MLRKEGFVISCNWEQKTQFGFIEQLHISKDGTNKWIAPIVLIYQKGDEDNGFSIYLESQGIKFDDTIKAIKNAIK